MQWPTPAKRASFLISRWRSSPRPLRRYRPHRHPRLERGQSSKPHPRLPAGNRRARRTQPLAISASLRRCSRRNRAAVFLQKSKRRPMTVAGRTGSQGRPTLSARQRATHLRAVRSLTPKPAPTSPAGRPSSTIRLATSVRPSGVRRALLCGLFILVTAGASTTNDHLQAFKQDKQPPLISPLTGNGGADNHPRQRQPVCPSRASRHRGASRLLLYPHQLLSDASIENVDGEASHTATQTTLSQHQRVARRRTLSLRSSGYSRRLGRAKIAHSAVGTI